MSTEIIAGKTFVEEEYAISEFGNQVISKGQAVRHFEKKHPEYRVIAISSFKIDHQDETISVRVQVHEKSSIPGGSKTLLQDAPQKLLNPGYDELKEKYDALYIVHEELKKQLEVFLDEDPIAGDDAE